MLERNSKSLAEAWTFGSILAYRVLANFGISLFGMTGPEGLGYLNTRAPSRRPKEMKSLLGLMGLSPLHNNRPSLAVVLNLMNAFDLDPDTLGKMHK